jgi:vacuolar-type H+-ATPase subunit I/STV1
METKRLRKGQIGAMSIVTIAVSIMIGLYVVSTIYGSFVGPTASTTFSASTEASLNNTFDNLNIGMTLMAIALIVGAAVFILGIMGGAR